MAEMTSVDWFGFMASVIVAFSLMQKDLVKLRYWNLLGASMFAVYGGIIEAMPVLFLNVFISIANVYYLLQMRREKQTTKN
ncbi:MAG: YgjV family protein [Psychrobium sp.]|nr:YgjV family protein [Psychrobium sp.]